MLRIPLCYHCKRRRRDFREGKRQLFKGFDKRTFGRPVRAHDFGIIMIHHPVDRHVDPRQLVSPRRDNALRFQHPSDFGIKPFQIEPMQRLRHGYEIDGLRFDPTRFRRCDPVLDALVRLRVAYLLLTGVRRDNPLE
jgi:hypothetical protein